MDIKPHGTFIFGYAESLKDVAMTDLLGEELATSTTNPHETKAPAKPNTQNPNIRLSELTTQRDLKFEIQDVVACSMFRKCIYHCWGHQDSILTHRMNTAAMGPVTRGGDGSGPSRQCGTDV